ncbi:GNAT family N-acetyltransferase [Agromyces sp. G08B096]|uniref:GNAT family N-acetyltransferase n=1 Tax=Agromyces sp. G08B096 TaxID=3156399 RepID=A0AAU7WAM1_9MICO
MPEPNPAHPTPGAPDAPSIALPAGAALPPGLVLRRPTPDDHGPVTAVIADWWGLPPTTHLPLLLPRLFFQHFADTSFLGEDDAGLAAFLIGFHSSSRPEVAYIHFVGVRPDLRTSGLARTLYGAFFDEARAAGCTRVEAITGPGNRRSQAFHRAMGFELTGDTEIDGVRAWRDYDGPGEHRVAFTRTI